MVAVPFLKLFTLTVKQLSKPMAKQLKKSATEHPKLRQVVAWMGQTGNRLSKTISIRAAGHRVTHIKPLEENQAVAAGGELLSELFLYTLGGGLLIWEYTTGAQKTAEKAAQQKLEKLEEKRKLDESLHALHVRLNEIEAKLYGKKGIWGLGLGILSGGSGERQIPKAADAKE